MIIHSKSVRHELHEYLRNQTHWKTIARGLLIGMGSLILIVWFGRNVIAEIEVIETWIEGHGALGWIVFVGMMIVFTSMFVPDTLLAIAAGAMFGLVGGTILTFVGAFLTAALNFLAAHGLFQTRIEKWLERHPKLRAIQQAANRGELRLQLLLRMLPINAVLVSYVMGATGVRFSTFLIATVGMIPAVIVNVYFGHTASHITKVAGNASEHSTLHTVMTVGGLVVCIVVMVAITRIATKAIADAESDQE